MNTADFDVMLNINDPNFAEKLAEAIGVQKGDEVTFITPQFARTDGVAVDVPVFDFNQLPNLEEETLKEIGCQEWDAPDEEGNVLWLFPAEWYDHIPNGTVVFDINGGEESFVKGETDDDMRFGALAYGFKRKA